ncbi:MAG: DUF4124 domain-containing protein [Thermomonas sp.]
MDRVFLPAGLSVLLLAAGLSASPASAEDVTIYRCTDARGNTTLRDTPCAKGQLQETRNMVRPKDAPARVESVAPTPAPQPQPAPQRTIVLAPPQPMYECRMPDGNTYTSDSPEGNPRWVPLWTLGYPVVTDGYYRPGGTSIVRHGDGRVDVNVDGGGYVRGPVPTIAGYGAGTWVRDECHMLPPSETCARLRDRREEIGKRFFNAQPTERDQLNREQRGIDARLDNDCGGH